jgi:hypothetical protein
MTDYQMSVGRDYNTARGYEFCIFHNEELVARAGGFSSTKAARRSGFRKADELAAAPRAIVKEPTRAELELELRARAPIQSRGKAVKDAGELPLFIAGNEPGLF